MIKAAYKKYILNFKNPSGTSRGILRTKETWFIILEENGKIGIGETGLFRGLSSDDVPNYKDKLIWACKNIDLGLPFLLILTTLLLHQNQWHQFSFLNRKNLSLIFLQFELS